MSLTLAPEASTSISSTSAPSEHRWELGVARRDWVTEARAEPPALLRAGPIRVLAIQRELHGAGEVRDLFTRAAEIACAECGFKRALILAVQGRTLSAHLMGALRDPDNDSLRRRIQAEPVKLEPGCVEADLLRIVKGGRGDAVEGWSALQRQHGLEQFALGAVVPEDEALALLVVDRPYRAVDFGERVTVQMFAQMLACSLERVIRRQRARESSSELQYMMTSASALLNEAVQAPVSFSAQSTPGFLFPGLAAASPPAYAVSELKELFTRREFSIARAVVAGRTNREIAHSLQLSPATVKNYVSRVLRKLGASNRAEAAAMYARLIDAV